MHWRCCSVFLQQHDRSYVHPKQRDDGQQYDEDKYRRGDETNVTRAALWNLPKGTLEGKKRFGFLVAIDWRLTPVGGAARVELIFEIVLAGLCVLIRRIWTHRSSKVESGECVEESQNAKTRGICELYVLCLWET